MLGRNLIPCARDRRRVVGYSAEALLLELQFLDSTTRVPGQTLTGVEKRYRTQWIVAMHAVMQHVSLVLVLATIACLAWWCWYSRLRKTTLLVIRCIYPLTAFPRSTLILRLLLCPCRARVSRAQLKYVEQQEPRSAEEFHIKSQARTDCESCGLAAP